MILHLKITGIILVLLSLLHIVFPKRFNWKQELMHLTLLNRQIMRVHTFFIAFAVFLMGILCLSSAEEITETSLGKKIALGLGLFWFIRLLTQLFGYSTKLWKGKTFETTVHITFSLLWIYISSIFLIIALY